MDNAANTPQLPEDTGDTSGGTLDADGSEMRTAKRFSLLIRAAKLVSHHGEFVCVVRDVSETGLALRMFHKVPTGEPLELHMPGGGVYELRPRWERENEAGFEFAQPIDVARMINEADQYPKRGLRLGIFLPIRIRTLTGSSEGIVENLSQQGARFETDGLFAIDQTVTLECLDGSYELSDVRAKVRWRRESEYGVVFENTMNLGDFARLAARLQCPALLN